MCARSAAGRRCRGWALWRRGASNSALLGIGRAGGHPVEIDRRDEVQVHGLPQVSGQIERLALGLQGRQHKGQGGEQLSGHPLGLGQMRAGSRGQIGRRGKALQTRSHRGKPGGPRRHRLHLSAPQFIGVIELAELTPQRPRPRLARLRLLVVHGGLTPRAQRRLTVLGEVRRTLARMGALIGIGLRGRLYLLHRRLGGGHARLGLLDLAGQVQTCSLAHLMLDMKEIRGMLGLVIVALMAAQRLRLIARALDHRHRQSGECAAQGLRPGGRRAVRGVLLEQDEIGNRLQGHQQMAG
jgi:hypothetical protein